MPPQQFYQNQRPVRRANNMLVMALIFAILSVMTVLTGILPVFFGSLAILFAILSKGNRLRMDSGALISSIIAGISIIAGLTLTGITCYGFTHDPEMKKMFNQTFKQMYGMDFDTYMDSMQHYYETGELPEYMDTAPLFPTEPHAFDRDVL